MSNYFATFIPGFSEVIKETLVKDFPKIQIQALLESSILFSTIESFESVISKPYLNNVFLVINNIRYNNNQLAGTIVKDLLKNIQIKPSFLPSSESKSFRIMVQQGTELVHVPRNFTTKIINSITKQTGYTFSPLKAAIEYWFLVRNEGFAILGIKLPQFKQPHQYINQPGMLQPEMAHIMNLISEPDKNDIYLDPFSGYGSLPFDRLLISTYTHIYISDNEKKYIKELKKISNKNVTVQLADALHLNYLKNESVNKIVSDPPWGIYKMQSINYEIFYKNMLSEMLRVVKRHGLIVILTAKKKEFEVALSNLQITLIKKYSTLVNGKKACVYKLTVE